MFEIGAGFDKRAATFRHFCAIDSQKAVGKDCGGEPQSRSLEHGRPKQAVEIDNVLANEMIELGVAAGLPPGVEGFAALCAVALEARDIADGGIEPDIKILAGMTWDFKAKIGCIPADIPVL